MRGLLLDKFHGAASVSALYDALPADIKALMPIKNEKVGIESLRYRIKRDAERHGLDYDGGEVRISADTELYARALHELMTTIHTTQGNEHRDRDWLAELGIDPATIGGQLAVVPNIDLQTFKQCVQMVKWFNAARLAEVDPVNAALAKKPAKLRLRPSNTP